jgi:hypothetical protein
MGWSYFQFVGWDEPIFCLVEEGCDLPIFCLVWRYQKVGLATDRWGPFVSYFFVLSTSYPYLLCPQQPPNTVQTSREECDDGAPSLGSPMHGPSCSPHPHTSPRAADAHERSLAPPPASDQSPHPRRCARPRPGALCSVLLFLLCSCAHRAGLGGHTAVAGQTRSSCDSSSSSTAAPPLLFFL